MAGFVIFAGAAQAETLASALAKAYNANPELNAARATARAVDELVPQARAGYRPRVNVIADAGVQNLGARTSPGTRARTQLDETFYPRGVALAVDQTIFNGFRTSNSVRQGESRVLGQRETLRNTEQNILVDGATSYMDVLRDTAILAIRKNNVEVLEEQLRQTQQRFQVGEVTRTDVAQSEARFQRSKSEQSLAQANLKTRIGRYRQVIGTEPRQLASASPIEKLLPKSLDAAMRTSQAEHPAIIASLHGVDAQLLQIKVNEADLYPTLAVRGALSKRYETSTPNSSSASASIVGTLTIPIYDGGLAPSRVREAKETLGERRLQVDVSRDRVRAAVVAAWSGLETAKAQILQAQAQVRAAEIALSGVREEAKVGQRTTLDVLNSQQELLDARVALITAQRDRVVASYNVLSAVGRLSAASLNLAVASYDPKVHYEQVKDKWHGLRTPSGQ